MQRKQKMRVEALGSEAEARRAMREKAAGGVRGGAGGPRLMTQAVDEATPCRARSAACAAISAASRTAPSAPPGLRSDALPTELSRASC